MYPYFYVLQRLHFINIITKQKLCPLYFTNDYRHNEQHYIMPKENKRFGDRTFMRLFLYFTFFKRRILNITNSTYL